MKLAGDVLVLKDVCDDTQSVVEHYIYTYEVSAPANKSTFVIAPEDAYASYAASSLYCSSGNQALPSQMEAVNLTRHDDALVQFAPHHAAMTHLVRFKREQGIVAASVPTRSLKVS